MKVLIFFKLGGNLYNPEKLRDKSKLNYYILENFIDKANFGIIEESIPIKIINLSSMLELEKANFEKQKQRIMKR
jgi:hypothetical protein